MQSYRIDIQVREDVLLDVLEHLKLSDQRPTITTNFTDVAALKKKAGFHSEEFGHYLPGENHVVIQTLPPSYARLPLFRLQPRIRETLLHELRHAHQYLVWPEHRRARMRDGGYWCCDSEKDARKWGYTMAMSDRFRKLVTVTRQELGQAVKLP